MLRTATSLGRSGIQDWLIQRISAVILACYTLYILYFWFAHSNATQEVWRLHFNNIFVKSATLLALLALLSHSWIGLWTVTTDYLKTLWLRLTVQIFVFIGLLFYLVWGIQILWG